MTTLNMEVKGEETARMVENVVVLRISTKHINPWMRQLETKKKGDHRAGWVDESGNGKERD